MSTWLYLRCEDHDPPLVNEHESGQHLTELKQIRADIADRDALVRIARTEDWIDLGGARNVSVSFLARHPKCRIGIVDEYGTDRTAADPLTWDGDDS